MMDLANWHGVIDTYAAKWGASIHIVSLDGQLLYQSNGITGDPFPMDEWQMILNLVSMHHSGFYYETIKGQRWFITPFQEVPKYRMVFIAGPVSSEVYTHSKMKLKEDMDQLTNLLSDLNSEFKRMDLKKSLIELSVNLKKGENWSPTIQSKVLPLGLIDMIGIAFKREKDHVYYIENVWGDGQLSLQHSSVQYGEGLLGYAATLGKTMVWTNVMQDPRSSYFEQQGISIETLMCFPIQNKINNGLLFMGSKYSFVPDESEMMLAEMLADEIGKQKEISYYLSEIKAQTTQIHTISEICQVMSESEDVQQVLYMIMDISLYLVSGTFCAMIWFDREQQDRANVFGRGISEERLSELGRSILSSWGKGEKRNLATKPSSFGEHIYEIPLCFRQTCYGVMVLDFSKVKHHEGYLGFFKTISTMSGMALHYIQQNLDLSVESLLGLLEETLYSLDGKPNVSYQEVGEFLKSFAKNEGWSDRTTALLLLTAFTSSFREGFMQSHMPLEVQKILDGIRNVGNRQGSVGSKGINDDLGGISYEQVGELLRIVFYWFGRPLEQRERMTQDDMLLLLKDQSTHGDLVQKLVDLIDGNKRTTLILGEKEETSAPIEDLSQYVQKLSFLTEREQEVLLLIAEGKNNKEIAQALFISENTVKNHITNILRKLGVSDRSQAMAALYQRRMMG